jgi:hypothetical protein
MATTNQIARALVVKELWQRAWLDARTGDETKWIAAAMLAGVGLETALKGALNEDPPLSRKDDPSLAVLIDKFHEKHQKEATKADVAAAHQLRKLRNGVQHGGSIPARQGVTRALLDVEPFLRKVFLVAYDTDIDAVDQVALIEDRVFAPALRAAFGHLAESRFAEALALAAACFEQVRFRLSAQMVVVRSPGKAHQLNRLLGGKAASISLRLLTEAVGVDGSLLVTREVCLDDKANRLLAYASMGMSSASLGLMEVLLDIMTRHTESPSSDTEQELAGIDAKFVTGVLDQITRDIWRLEESQPELFGAGYRRLDDGTDGEVALQPVVAGETVSAPAEGTHAP